MKYEMDSYAKEYKERFLRHYDELKWLYCELYPGRVDKFEDLCDSMYQYYKERKADLKIIDRKREQNPGWYKGNQMMGMMLYVDAFAGNLSGVRDKLDYIEECQVNYIHLMPLLDSPEGKSDGGYAVSDFRKVKPELGTMDELEQLSKACHDRGISVCLDFVMNHQHVPHDLPRRITR